MLTVQEIKTFIDKDLASESKQQAMEGERYYNCHHDIEKKRIFFINADGKLEEDKTKANTKISHPFFMENVDQTVQYLFAACEDEDAVPIFQSEQEELQKELDARFNENDDFMVELTNIVEGAVKKGFEYAYAYRDDDGKITFARADSLGVVMVRKEATEDHCDYVIRYYTDTVEKDSKEIRRVEVWDEQQVTFYVQEGKEGEILLDESVEHNPRPHTFLKREGDAKIYFEGFGFIPFIELPYNENMTSGLHPIKDLIDDYDEMNCGLSNMIIETAEALYVVTGFEGDNLDELMQNIKAKKHIGVDENGGVEIKTIDIPVDARKAKMDEDKRNIYQFGQMFNVEGLKDTAATTNLAIEQAYYHLELKRVKLAKKVKQFLRKIAKITLDDINKAEGKNYTMKDVQIVLKKKVPTNEKENAEVEQIRANTEQTKVNTILNIGERLDDETVLEKICEEMDYDFDKIKAKMPKEEAPVPTAPAKAALENLPPEDGDMSA